MKPIVVKNGLALWYSSDDRGYYWQDQDGWGNKTSQIFRTVSGALRSKECGKLKMKD